MIEKCINFISSGFWQAILVVVIAGLFVSILIGILRSVFSDVNFEKTSVFYKIFFNIIYWGTFIAVFFAIWHIRQGKGWFVFGIISVVCFIGSLLGSLISKKTDENREGFPNVREEMKKINEDKIARLIQENNGKIPVYEIYNTLAISNGEAGERFRQENRINEALECDFQGFSLMEKAIELSNEAPEEKQIQYKRDIIIACIYVSSDLLKMGRLFESITYCEKIINYGTGIPLDDLKHSILVHAANYDERNLELIKKKFGEQGLKKSIEIGGRLRTLINQ
jgi:hypothetical protein